MRMLDYKGQKGDPLSAYVESVKVYWKDEKGYKGPWMKCRKFEIDYGFEVKSQKDRELLENMETGHFAWLHIAMR